MSALHDLPVHSCGPYGMTLEEASIGRIRRGPPPSLARLSASDWGILVGCGAFLVGYLAVIGLGVRQVLFLLIGA